MPLLMRCVPRFTLRSDQEQIRSLNELDLLGARPAFDFLFSFQRVVNVFVMLKPHKPMTTVLSSKARNQGRNLCSCRFCAFATLLVTPQYQNTRAAANHVDK